MELFVSAYEESRMREMICINRSIEIIKNNTNADKDGGLRTSMSEFLECNQLEKIYVDAVIKKNIELIELIFQRINEKLMSIMDMSDELSRQEDSCVNERGYLTVCEYSKLKYEKIKTLHDIVKLYI
jgi:hypothetical protein